WADVRTFLASSGSRSDVYNTLNRINPWPLIPGAGMVGTLVAGVACAGFGEVARERGSCASAETTAKPIPNRMARTQARAFIECLIAEGLLVGRIPSQPVARVHEKRPSGSIGLFKSTVWQLLVRSPSRPPAPTAPSSPAGRRTSFPAPAPGLTCPFALE